ncbi:GTPase [uncultured Muriicola sp.]|uniref:GTPase n=1 Tax=uncultured Muriicola sp. TaxID=1583102 RepID=UPI0026339A3E|nr:GTPase [uncultured Muriicola sp.]
MTKDPIRKLVFVYNADSGIKNGLLDFAHKIISPRTYECRLCELTFGTFAEKSLWKKFRQDHKIEMEFLHKDEFLKTYASKFMPAYTFPVILEITAHDLDLFLGAKEMNALTETQELINAIQNRLARTSS